MLRFGKLTLGFCLIAIIALSSTADAGIFRRGHCRRSSCQRQYVACPQGTICLMYQYMSHGGGQYCSYYAMNCGASPSNWDGPCNLPSGNCSNCSGSCFSSKYTLTGEIGTRAPHHVQPGTKLNKKLKKKDYILQNAARVVEEPYAKFTHKNKDIYVQIFKVEVLGLPLTESITTYVGHEVDEREIKGETILPATGTPEADFDYVFTVKLNNSDDVYTVITNTKK